MTFRRNAAAAAAPFALLLALAGGVQAQRFDLDRYKGREREAIDTCRRHAEDVLNENGGRRDVEVEEISRTDENDDKVKVQGYLRVYNRDGDRRPGWLDCTVDFDGDTKIVSFDEDSLLRDRDRKRDRKRDRRGDLREQASAACRDMVEDQGYEVGDVRDRDRVENGMRLDMRLRRSGRGFDATCIYNSNQDEARFARLEPDRS